MSQYKNQITGDIVANIRVINGNLYNIPSSQNYTITIYDQDSTHDQSNPYYITPSNGIITRESLYMNNIIGEIYFPNTIQVGTDFTLSCWTNVTNYPTGRTGSGEYCGIGVSYYKDPIFYAINNWFYHYFGAIGVGWHIECPESGEKIDHPSSPLSLNNPVHFACCKSGNNFYYFFNGVLQHTLSYVGQFLIDHINLATNKNASIYFDDIVVINNQALWTSNFTVPNGPLLGKLPRIDKKDYIYKMSDFNSDYYDKAYLY